MTVSSLCSSLYITKIILHQVDSDFYSAKIITCSCHKSEGSLQHVADILNVSFAILEVNLATKLDSRLRLSMPL